MKESKNAAPRVTRRAVLGGKAAALAVPAAASRVWRESAAESPLRESGVDTRRSVASIDRTMHAAVSLQAGRLLVAGGALPRDGAMSSVHVYEPGSGAWREASSMSIPRCRHVAVVLRDGRVLVAGGIYLGHAP